MARLNLGEPVLQGNIKLVPFMSDAYFEVTASLYNSSVSNKQNMSFVAGLVLIAVAGMESYISELHHMARKQSHFSFPKNIQQLKREAKIPDHFSDKTYEDITMLYGLRGLLAHYKVNEEVPKESKTSLQKIQKYFPNIIDAEKHVSLEKLLNPSFAEWVMNVWRAMVQELYQAGYEPPRPFWIRQFNLRKI